MRTKSHVGKNPISKKSQRTKSQRTKSQRTKSQRTKSQRTKSQRTKSQRTKSQRTKSHQEKSHVGKYPTRTKSHKEKLVTIQIFVFFWEFYKRSKDLSFLFSKWSQLKLLYGILKALYYNFFYLLKTVVCFYLGSVVFAVYMGLVRI